MCNHFDPVGFSQDVAALFDMLPFSSAFISESFTSRAPVDAVRSSASPAGLGSPQGQLPGLDLGPGVGEGAGAQLGVGGNGAGGKGVAPGELESVGAWPGYTAPFIRLTAPPGKAPKLEVEALPGRFGLIPHWANEEKARTIGRSTFNARSETVAEKPSFRDAWRSAQRCIIPAHAIYEPDWRTGKSIERRITRADGRPLGIAGLWARRPLPEGRVDYSFTMLTINADNHPVFQNFHRPEKENGKW